MGRTWFKVCLFLFGMGTIAWPLACTCGVVSQKDGELATNLPGNLWAIDDKEIPPEQSKLVLLYNKGQTPITIESIKIETTQPGSFFLRQTPAFPLVLPPGEDRGIPLQLLYRYQQSKGAQALLKIVTSLDPETIPSQTTTIKLRASPLQPKPILSCKDGLNFGNISPQKINVKDCRLQNVGGADLVIEKAWYKAVQGSPQTFQWLLPNLPTRVYAGDSKLLRIKFDMTTEVIAQPKGTIVLQMSYGKGTNVINTQFEVKGYYNTPCFKVTPTTIDFGDVPVGCRVRKLIQVEAIGPIAEHCFKASIEEHIATQRNGTFLDLRNNSGPISYPLPCKKGWKRKFFVDYQSKKAEKVSGQIQLVTNISRHPKLIVNVRGQPVYLPRRTETFPPSRFDAIGILFVLDNSARMKGFQPQIRRHMEQLAKYYKSYSDTLKVAVITGDVSGKQYKPGCAQGGSKVIKNYEPNFVTQMLQNTSVGTSGSKQQSYSDAIHAALSTQMATDSNCFHKLTNVGSAVIIVIGATQESRPMNANSLLYHINSQFDPGYRIDIKLNLVSGVSPTGCWMDDKKPGWTADSNDSLVKLSKLSKGKQISLCKKDWYKDLKDLPLSGLSQRRHYLSLEAHKHTIKVRAGHLELTPEDWSYEVERTMYINLKGLAKLPHPEYPITVSYVPICPKP